MDSSSRGRLVCVGVGMTLGSHLAPLARSHIEKADVVFAVMSDGLVEQWLSEMHPDVRSLQPLYREGKSRADTYREMVETMLAEVRAGKRVCGAFYGHPGVFAWPPHKAIEQARREGFEAHMEPGISAEDCLYADLGIDPGRYGCQHYAAGQLLFYERVIDLAAYLVLWQVGVTGDRSMSKLATGSAYRQVLVDVLVAHGYPPLHEVTLYHAPTLPTQRATVRHLPLCELAQCELPPQVTLVLPPAQTLVPNRRIAPRLDAIDRTTRVALTLAWDRDDPAHAEVSAAADLAPPTHRSSRDGHLS